MRAASETVAAPAPGDTPGVRAATENASGKNPAVPSPTRTSPQGPCRVPGRGPDDDPGGHQRRPQPQDPGAAQRVGQPVANQPPGEHSGHRNWRGSSRSFWGELTTVDVVKSLQNGSAGGRRVSGVVFRP
jgi:hypothetical protein